MAFASIPLNNPIVKPAEEEQTFSYLDLSRIGIVKRGGNYSVRAVYVPYDDQADESLEDSKVNYNILDFVAYTSDKPTLRAAARAFAKELALALQADPPVVPEP